MANKDLKIDDHVTKLIVLKHNLDDVAVKNIINRKKIDAFKTMLKRPSKDKVHTHSIKFFYEIVLKVSAKYTANFYRKAFHTIKVDHNVDEVVLGEGVFQINTKSRIEKTFARKYGKNKVNLELEEHVFIENENSMYFDHHGKEINFSLKINSKMIENYPKRILRNNEPNIRKTEITKKDALERLNKKLQQPLKSDIRDLDDKFVIKEIAEIYMPVFEARLIGPKKKIAIMRIDAVRKKIL